jgi:hypothetical protein
MDQDDVSYPERFEYQVRALQNDPELDLIAVRAITISEGDEPIGFLPCATTHEEICARPWRGFYFAHPTWMGRIAWFRKHRYAVPGPYFCEDQELLLRTYRVSRFSVINEVLFGYRIRSKVIWRKLFKTRLTFLGIQLRYFVRAHQPYFVLLAIIVSSGRVLSDIRKLFGHIPAQSRPRVVSVDSIKWREVLRGFQGQSASDQTETRTSVQAPVMLGR